MDSKCTTYLDRWKWWGPSLLIHALVALVFLYPFAPGKDTANSDDELQAIAVVFAPKTQIPTAPVTSPIIDSPKLPSPQSTTAIPKVASNTTQITLNAPAKPGKTAGLSAPIAIPRHLPKSRHVTVTMPPAPILETAKVPTKVDVPLSRLPQSSSVKNSTKIIEINDNVMNKNIFLKKYLAETMALAGGAKPDINTSVTASALSKPASLAASTLSGDTKALSMTTEGNSEALAMAADMDHVKSWGQGVRGTLVKLTKGLQSRGSAKVAIRLSRTGELIGITFIEKSQNERFNRELDRRIKISGVFPAAPRRLAIDEMVFPIRLTVNR